MTPPSSREPGQAGVTEIAAQWLRTNWTPTHPSFRNWVAGSDRAHEIVLGLLADRTRYREVLRLWDDHLPGCSGSPRCECGYEEARALLEEVPDAE